MPHSRAKRPLDILLVEDDASDALLIEAMLGDVCGNGRLVRAGSLDELRVLSSEGFEPDVVLLDLTLPDSVGVATVSEARAICAERPIVVLTGADDDALGLACIEAGAQDYVPKADLRPELLARVVLYTLARARDAELRRGLEREVVEARSREQRRIAHDLHDGLGQSLAGIGLLCGALTKKLRARGIPEVELAARLGELVQQAIAESKGLARMLDPVTDDEGGLVAALEELVAGLSRLLEVPIAFTHEGVRFGDNQAATHLYRIAQEAITNAVKHAGASRIRVGLCDRGGRIVLTVEDDGRGLPEPADRPPGLGLRIMAHRARTIGGKLTVEPGPEGKGVRVVCSVGRERPASDHAARARG